jgi:hypothetical protein
MARREEHLSEHAFTMRDDRVTIILNKTALPFYALGGNSQHTAPAVVSKLER